MSILADTLLSGLGPVPEAEAEAEPVRAVAVVAVVVVDLRDTAAAAWALPVSTEASPDMRDRTRFSNLSMRFCMSSGVVVAA
jgi:hypothetical protein